MRCKSCNTAFYITDYICPRCKTDNTPEDKQLVKYVSYCPKCETKQKSESTVLSHEPTGHKCIKCRLYYSAEDELEREEIKPTDKVCLKCSRILMPHNQTEDGICESCKNDVLFAEIEALTDFSRCTDEMEHWGTEYICNETLEKRLQNRIAELEKEQRDHCKNALYLGRNDHRLDYLVGCISECKRFLRSLEEK